MRSRSGQGAAGSSPSCHVEERSRTSPMMVETVRSGFSAIASINALARVRATPGDQFLWGLPK